MLARGKRRRGPPDQVKRAKREPRKSRPISEAIATNNIVTLSDESAFTARVAGVEISALLDTGAAINLLHKSVVDMLPNVKICKTATRAKTASQSDLPLLGRVTVPFQVGNISEVISFYVTEAIDKPMLLGLEFLRSVPCVIDLTNKRLVLAGSGQVRNVSAEITSVGKVTVGQDYSLAPGTEQIIPGYIHNCTYRGDAIVEPEMALQGVEVRPAIVDVKGPTVPVIVRNVSLEPITIRKHTPLAGLEVSFVEEEASGKSEPIDPISLESKLDSTDLNLTQEQRLAFWKVLEKHKTLFDGHIGKTGLVSHSIDTGDHLPIRSAPRRIPPHLRDQVKAHIDELVAQGILEPSDSEWSSPICLVKKKSGEMRMCADMRRLNAISKLASLPIPNINDTLEALAGSSLFCALDLNSAYFQIPIEESSKDKTAIITPFGQYRYTRLCFGLHSGGYSITKLLDKVLGDLSRQKVVYYFDDAVCHGQSFEEVLVNLDEVLSRLESAGLTLSLAKCQFFKTSTTFLGHVVSAEGLGPDPVKVAKVREWPIPRTAKELSSFLGLCSYFKKYIRGHAAIASRLFALTAKDAKFEWDATAQAAFDALKQALCEAPVVALPKFGKDAPMFTVDCDASNESVGAVLLQADDEGQEKVIAYGSHRLSKAQRNYSTTKKELLAVVTFVTEWSHYLTGKKFRVRTDHSSLQWLLNFKNPSGMLARWLDTLGNFKFDVIYRAGSLNSAADGLSRRHLETADVGCQTEAADSAESASCRQVTARDWPLSYIALEQCKDENIAQVKRFLAEGRRPRRRDVSEDMHPWLRQYSRLRLLEGALFRVFKRKPRDQERLQVVIPPHLVEGILSSAHMGPCGGHFSAQKLLGILQERYFWPDMGRDVERFCAECERCMTRNPPVPAPRAAMGELHASEPWQVVSIDFLTDLPVTAAGNRHLLVCCDHFTRWCEAFPVPDMTARTVAVVLTREIFSRFSVPQVIHSDQAGNFRSELLAEVYRIMGVKRSQTSSYHPQGNGKCERVHRVLLGMLSKHLEENQHSSWDEHLPLLLLGYRTQIHRSLGYSPFFLMFGRQPRLPVDAEIDAPGRSKSVTITEYVDKLREGLRDAYKEAIKISNSSHEKNKHLYDRKLNTFEYKAGDKALLFRKVVKRGEFYKFLRPWRPITIVEKRGDLNYRIRTDGGKMLTVHHNRLRPSNMRDPMERDADNPETSGGSHELESPAMLRPHPPDESESSVARSPIAGPPLLDEATVGVRRDVNDESRMTPTHLSRRSSSRTRRPPDRLVLSLRSVNSILV